MDGESLLTCSLNSLLVTFGRLLLSVLYVVKDAVQDSNQ